MFEGKRYFYVLSVFFYSMQLLRLMKKICIESFTATIRREKF